MAVSARKTLLHVMHRAGASMPWPRLLAAAVALTPGTSASALCDAADELEEDGIVTREALGLGGTWALAEPSTGQLSLDLAQGPPGPLPTPSQAWRARSVLSTPSPPRRWPTT